MPYSSLDISKREPLKFKSSTAPNHAVLDSAFYFFLSRRRNLLKISLEGLEHKRHSWTPQSFAWKNTEKVGSARPSQRFGPILQSVNWDDGKLFNLWNVNKMISPQQNANIPHSMWLFCWKTDKFGLLDLVKSPKISYSNSWLGEIAPWLSPYRPSSIFVTSDSTCQINTGHGGKWECHGYCFLAQMITSWWFQPQLKNMLVKLDLSSNWIISIGGMKIQNIFETTTKESFFLTLQIWYTWTHSSSIFSMLTFCHTNIAGSLIYVQSPSFLIYNS